MDPDHWRGVIRELEAAPTLTAAQRVQLARAHWWRLDVPEATRHDELAYEQHLSEGSPTDAAAAALRVCLMWATRGNIPIAMAWQERAARLLRERPPCVVHGYATYMAAAAALDIEEDVDAAARAAIELHALAERFADRTLECFALTLDGMAAVRRGDLTGFAALDQAMIPVLSGQVDPLWGGDIYCTVIHLCEGLGDLARMRAWTDALNAWSRPLSETFLYAGVTRIHQLTLLREEGSWDAVEQELGRRSDDLAEAHGWLAGAGFYELGEVHRLRGDEAAALASYERARRLGVEPQPGEALLRHARGDTAAGLDALRVGLAGAGPLARARLLPAVVDLALASGDDALADQAAGELEATAARYGTPGLLARAARARGTCLRSSGRWEAARVQLEQAARLHRQQRQRHDLAQVHEALAEVHRGLGQEAGAAAAAATARAIYDALGARVDLERMARVERPAGLTAREVEVLARVAAGLTNKQVAEALVISDKTVSRHLGSIFTKIDVSTRTAAAAWARRHGLA